MRTKIPKFQTKLFLRNGYDFLTERNFVFTHRFSEISKLIQKINHINAHSAYNSVLNSVLSQTRTSPVSVHESMDGRNFTVLGCLNSSSSH